MYFCESFMQLLIKIPYYLKRQKKREKPVLLFCYYPFNAQEDTGVLFHRNFNSILRRDHEKMSYERRTYESVDEKSLS